MSLQRQAIVAAVGLGSAALLVVALGLPASDGAQLIAIAFGTALIAVIVGQIALARMRAASVARQAVVVSLVSVAGCGLGAMVAAQAMFVSGHDLDALFVILAASATAGVLAALRLGAVVGSESFRLGEVARSIGTGDDAPRTASTTAPRELAHLASEIDAMQARLDESAARERQLEQSRRELVAWVSHDLRTPLAGIRAMVEALADGIVDDPAVEHRYFETMQAEVDRLAALVDDLFELSRIQAAAVRLSPERAPLGDLVSDAVASSRPKADQREVRIEGNVVGPDPVLTLSAPEISRVVHNLLDNAIHHTPRGGRVTVEVGTLDGNAGGYVAVADTCGGIPDADIARVFDLAFRGDDARSPEHGRGGGLGLAIAQEFAEAHGGHITVANIAAGCRFVMTLPDPDVELAAPTADDRVTAAAVQDDDAQRSSELMSRSARAVPSTVPVTFDRPTRGE